MKSTLCLALVLLLSGANLLYAEPEIKGTPSELNAFLKKDVEFVTITDDATLNVEAQNAVVIMSVLSENESLSAALKQNQEIRQEITGQLIKCGLTPDQIQNAKFSSTPRYGLIGKKPKSYRVENIVNVTLKKAAEFQYVAQLIDRYKELDYRELKLIRENENELYFKVLKLALENLNKKKELYEKSLNVKLVPKLFRDVKISKNDQSVQAGFIRPDYIDVSNVSSFSSSSSSDSGSGSGNSESVQSPISGALIINAQISVDYIIEKIK